MVVSGGSVRVFLFLEQRRQDARSLIRFNFNFNLIGTQVRMGISSLPCRRGRHFSFPATIPEVQLL